MIKTLKKFQVVFITALVIALIIIGEGIAIANLSKKNKEKDATIKKQNEATFVAEEITSKVDIKVLTSEMQSIGELVTVEYLYADAGQFSDSKKINGVEIPLTQKSFVVRWEGTIKAGIDLSKVTIEDVSKEDDKILKIRIPKAEIISHEINNNSFETLDESNGLFNRITVDDVNTFVGDNKEFMEARVIENGILSKATENAKTQIKYLMDSYDDVVAGKYTLEFEEY